MEKLGLEVTRPYKDLYSFDSSRVRCLGLIKYLCVNLAQIPAKSLVTDIVVADIPPKYGMLHSRSWGAKLQGTMQMDMTYATIPVFSQPRRLYRETHMKYMVSNQERPENSPLYSIHTDLDSFILFNDDIPKEQELISEKTSNPVITSLSNIATAIDEEENKGEIKKQFAD